MRNNKVILLIISILILCIGCGRKDTKKESLLENHSVDISSELTYSYTRELDYADQFCIDEYEGGYALITMANDAQYLVVPEKMDVPDDLNKDIVILKQPVDDIYLVASSTMDMFVKMEGISKISFSALNEESWYIDEAREALKNGNIKYAGKYNAPDYEMLVDGGCKLAVENTMIYHSPDIKEKIEELGIPVIVDYSSYEHEPLGRTEWVKVYGRITGCMENAEKAFDEQKAQFLDIEKAKNSEKEKKSVAFFYITSDGQVNVRKSEDYMAKMIDMAGGRYVFTELKGEDNASATVTMTMEEFYAAACDADYIIYNSSIDGEIHSVDDLLKKSELLEDFKAVKDGHVFCTTQNIYQSSMELGTIIVDIHSMLVGNGNDMTYIYKVD